METGFALGSAARLPPHRAGDNTCLSLSFRHGFRAGSMLIVQRVSLQLWPLGQEQRDRALAATRWGVMGNCPSFRRTDSL